MVRAACVRPWACYNTWDEKTFFFQTGPLMKSHTCSRKSWYGIYTFLQETKLIWPTPENKTFFYDLISPCVSDLTQQRTVHFFFFRVKHWNLHSIRGKWNGMLHGMDIQLSKYSHSCESRTPCCFDHMRSFFIDFTEGEALQESEEIVWQAPPWVEYFFFFHQEGESVMKTAQNISGQFSDTDLGMRIWWCVL